MCRKETAKLERLEGIPAHLLTAISLAESGRWDETNRVSAAWPWTVMAQGEGRFYDTKEQALAEVKKLQKRGVTNIDVGCMQINMGYHGHNFRSLEDAFDPAANVRYAAQYLKQMQATAKDWTLAAGYYHSTTPDRTDNYKTKVQKIWDNERRAAGAPITGAAMLPASATRVAGGTWTMQTGSAQAPFQPKSAPARSEPPRSEPAQPAEPQETTAELIGRNFIDTARTQWLNQQFRNAREAERRVIAHDPSEIRRRQMAALRDARTSLVASADLAARRRAEAESERKQMMEARFRAEQQARAQQRRQTDLENWRRRALTADSES